MIPWEVWMIHQAKKHWSTWVRYPVMGGGFYGWIAPNLVGKCIIPIAPNSFRNGYLHYSELEGWKVQKLPICVLFLRLLVGVWMYQERLCVESILVKRKPGWQWMWMAHFKNTHKCIDNLSYLSAVYSNQVHAAFASKYFCKQGLNKK